MEALRIVLGYRNSTPLNVILAAREPPLYIRFRYLGLNFLSQAVSISQHIMVPFNFFESDFEGSHP